MKTVKYFFFIVLNVILFEGCNKEPGLPVLATVTTSAVTDITQNTAISGGNITSNGSSLVTARGICWNRSRYFGSVGLPTIEDDRTTDGAGPGSFTSSITGLSGGSSYIVRAYATNSEGTSYGNVVGCSTQLPTDIDGNVYHIFEVVSQVWFVENLKATRCADGTAIPLVTDSTTWSNLTTAGYCWYNNDASTYNDTYGALYNWYAVNTCKLCPSGYHVATDSDWSILVANFDGENAAGYYLKLDGFAALMGGFRVGAFYSIGDVGEWWSSSSADPATAWGHYILENNATVFGGNFSKSSGFSVRCIRD